MLGSLGLSGTKKRRRRSIRAVVSKLKLVVCQTGWQDVRGLSTLHCLIFVSRKNQERERWGGSMTGPEVAETAQVIVGRRRGENSSSFSLCGVVCCKGAAIPLVPRVLSLIHI